MTAPTMPARAGSTPLDQRRVERAILSVFPEKPTLGSVAAVLGVHMRTLQRRLAESGLSFQVILDDTRRDNAERLLREGSVPIGEIAARLGYSDTAHFTRAFRRWTGELPSRYRLVH